MRARCSFACLIALACPPLAQQESSNQDKDEHKQQPPIRVLYLEDKPRWEYRYVVRALGPRSPDVELETFLFTVKTELPGKPKHQLPPTREELSRYDVILIGDVPKRRLGEDAESIDRWLRLLSLFARTGGGVGFLAGHNAMPRDYVGTHIEELLPVRLERKAAWQNRQVSAVPPDASELHAIARLADEPEQSEKIWQGLSRLYSVLAITKLAANGQAVLVSDRGKQPLILAAAGERRRGHTFFIASDTTWRWRAPAGERHFERFWNNVVTYLASGRAQRRKDRRRK